MFKSLKDILFRSRKYDFYLGGPMRGYPQLNAKMFTLISHMLRTKGFTVWNPSEHDSYLQLSFGQCMIADLNAVINECRKVVLLPGWRDSLGANIEVFVAFACNKDVFEIVLNDERTDFEFVSVDVSEYILPYKDGETCPFNPHNCDLDSFEERR